MQKTDYIQCMRTAPYKQISSDQISANNFTIKAGTIQQKKQCKYRLLDDGELPHSDDTRQQYQHFMINIIQQYSLIKDENFDDQQSIKDSYEDFNKHNQENSENLENSNESQDKEDILNFLGKQKLNVYKNILYAFNKHIETCTNNNLMQLYQSFTENWDFNHIKKRVSQNLKGTGRPSLKFRNLLKSKNLKKIFEYFLENANDIWLSDSKIKDKELYIKSISLLLKGSKYDIVIKNIQYYRKNKK